MDSALVFAPFGLAGIAIAVVVPVLFRLYRGCSIEEITPEWLETFSVSSYEPMEHLLSGEDFSFLKRQPGYDLGVLKRFRRDRLRIFRQYLNRMIRDFNRLQLAARVLIARSADDRSSLLKQLVSLRVRFTFAVIHAEFSYALCRLGCSTVAAYTLIARLEEMSAQLNALTAANAFNPA